MLAVRDVMSAKRVGVAVEGFSVPHVHVHIVPLYAFDDLDPSRARALEAALGEPESAKLAWRPQNEVTVTGDDAATLMKLLDALEDDDDVQEVYANFDIPEQVLEAVTA